jgi:multidrug efflux pump subunit AcrA (membrane-fusion protein)
MGATLPKAVSTARKRNKRLIRRGVTAVTAVLIVGVMAATAIGFVGRQNKPIGGLGPEDARPAGDENKPAEVPVIRPKRDANFRVTNQQLAVVEPFYQAGLRSRVSGEVKYVAKDIGEAVRAGELLVEIDVPDLQAAVAQKDAVITQRQRELALAEADIDVAEAVLQAATAAVRSKAADVTRAENTRSARKADLDNLLELFKGEPQVKAKVDAARFDHEAAKAAVTAAEVAVEEAKAAETGKRAGLTKAKADVELRRAFVEVARKDRDAAAAQLAYARVYAPFDGVILARSADPGKFVPGAASGFTEPLVTVARTDLLTVVVKLPDNAAAFVTRNTELLVEFEQLPGVTVRGPVTRFSSSIDPTDRTRRVEVDVYNGTRRDYQKMLVRAAAETAIAPMVPLDPFTSVVAAGTAQVLTKADHKGWHEGAALTPDWGDDPRPGLIIPGMNATARVYLDRFTNAYLLPASAVYSKGGRAYLLTVQDGVTKAVPVAVLVNDGRLVRVGVLGTVNGRPVTRELTGKEVIVSARQQEVGEGQRVEPVFEEW